MAAELATAVALQEMRGGSGAGTGHLELAVAALGAGGGTQKASSARSRPRRQCRRAGRASMLSGDGGGDRGEQSSWEREARVRVDPKAVVALHEFQTVEDDYRKNTLERYIGCTGGWRIDVGRSRSH